MSNLTNINKIDSSDIKKCPHCNQLIAQASINFDKHRQYCFSVLLKEIKAKRFKDIFIELDRS